MLSEFYNSLNCLAEKTGGVRELGSANGRMMWPTRGVYLFFEPGEIRCGSGAGKRVVRVGTHALRADSRSTSGVDCHSTVVLLKAGIIGDQYSGC